jgi:hypothetical protein
MSYSDIRCQATFLQALSLARGSYQADILRGVESLSGSTLRGTASRYSGRYKKSSQEFIRRCQSEGLAIREEIRKHGKRVLVVG